MFEKKRFAELADKGAVDGISGGGGGAFDFDLKIRSMRPDNGTSVIRNKAALGFKAPRLKQRKRQCVTSAAFRSHIKIMPVEPGSRFIFEQACAYLIAGRCCITDIGAQNSASGNVRNSGQPALSAADMIAKKRLIATIF